jgi:hypothetical protein
MAGLFGRTGNNEHRMPSLSSALAAVTNCISSAPGIGELDAPNRDVTLNRLPDFGRSDPQSVTTFLSQLALE